MNRGDRYRIDALVELASVFPAALTVAAIARRRRIPEAFLARLLGPLPNNALADRMLRSRLLAWLPGAGGDKAALPVIRRLVPV